VNCSPNHGHASDPTRRPYLLCQRRLHWDGAEACRPWIILQLYQCRD
jgi:hypothetical protein